jgi:hypothetical protein
MTEDNLAAQIAWTAKSPAITAKQIEWKLSKEQLHKK